jgi:hypothetical protein
MSYGKIEEIKFRFYFYILKILNILRKFLDLFWIFHIKFWRGRIYLLILDFLVLERKYIIFYFKIDFFGNFLLLDFMRKSTAYILEAELFLKI